MHALRQQIQALNYELDACLRIFASGQITVEHLIAFNEAVARRDHLTAQVMRHLAEILKRNAAEPAAAVAPEPPPAARDNLVRLPHRHANTAVPPAGRARAGRA